jgi:hypothetical protein
MRGTMKRFEKGTLDLFKAGRKSDENVQIMVTNCFSAYSKLFILFFYEGSLVNFKISGPEKNIWGWFSVPPDCPSYARCNSESMRGTMKRFEKGTLDLFKAGRKSVISTD